MQLKYIAYISELFDPCKNIILVDLGNIKQDGHSEVIDGMEYMTKLECKV